MTNDKRSIRFYTRREIEKLFYRAGYALRDRRAEQNPELERWRSESMPAEIVTGSLRISAQSPEEAEEFITERYQALAIPAKGTEDRLQGTVDSGQEESAGLGSRNVERKDNGQLTTDYGLTSIVIVTFNQLAYTRMCLESIRFRTDEPYELIVVDNGSTDGTVEYLRSAADVKLIENAGNLGFPAAANQGILAGRGRQILLLNNDVIVTTGWLRRMLDALDGDSLAAVANAVPGVLESAERGMQNGVKIRNPKSKIRNLPRSASSVHVPTASVARSKCPSATTTSRVLTGSPGTGAGNTTHNGTKRSGWSGSACSSGGNWWIASAYSTSGLESAISKMTISAAAQSKPVTGS